MSLGKGCLCRLGSWRKKMGLKIFGFVTLLLGLWGLGEAQEGDRW